MYFLDKIQTQLKHTAINIEGSWEPQWEYNKTFSIDKTGNFKLAFLLFKESTEEYDYSIDYKDIAKEKIDDAYRETHLWINVK
jgi:uncharacterized membrane protein